MIKDWFPSKRIVKQLGHVITHDPDVYGARRAGLSVEEYRRRSIILQENKNRLAALGWKTGQTLYPKKWDDYQKYGPVAIIYTADTINQYGTTKWDDTFPKFLRLRLLDDAKSFLDAPIDWISDKQPSPFLPEVEQQC